MADGSIRKREGRRSPWEVRFRDPSGQQISRSFQRKRDAQQWLAEQTAQISRGAYVDPRAGQISLAAFVEQWLAGQVWDSATRVAVESRMANHVVPQLGDMPLATIRPSVLQQWIAGRSAVLAPRTVRVLLANLSSVLGAAVEDGLIARNPCSSRAVRAPAVDQAKVVPWSAEQVQAVVDAHPDRWRAVPIVAVGLGLRQGEVFGLRVVDVEFLRRTVQVRQQIKVVDGQHVAALPKRRKTRSVPLAPHVGDALAERLRAYPASGDDLVFRTREGGPLQRRYYNRSIWKPALVEAGIEPTRRNGLHMLRHVYASTLLSEGVGVRAVAAYLGHDDPGFTLRVYGHLMPDDDDRARRAIGAVLGRHVGQVWAKPAE